MGRHRKTFRVEDSYRAQRTRFDVLMDGDAPAGGRWNWARAVLTGRLQPVEQHPELAATGVGRLDAGTSSGVRLDDPGPSVVVPAACAGSTTCSRLVDETATGARRWSRAAPTMADVLVATLNV